MTTYTWPDARAYVPQSAELRVIDNLQRVLESPLSGYVQTQSMPGARWGWAYDMAPQTEADRQALEGYLLRLSGREHRVRLWDIKRPRPRGNIALSGVTLGAAPAQFATSLQLAGCMGSNHVLNGSFEVDGNADGLADGWTRYGSGDYGALTHSRSTSVAITAGVYSQNLVAASLGATSADQQGIFGQVRNVHLLAGRNVTVSATALGTAGARLSLQVAWLDGLGGGVGAINSAALLLNGADQSLSATGACPANAVQAVIYLYQHSGPGGAVGLYLDRVQVEAGDVVRPAGDYATLLAGDWLGLATGQLVRVVADATADDAGAMTVEVRHMLRSEAASGSAVTLDKPTALYVRTESGLALPRQAGNVEPGLGLEFVEVFA